MVAAWVSAAVYKSCTWESSAVARCCTRVSAAKYPSAVSPATHSLIMLANHPLACAEISNFAGDLHEANDVGKLGGRETAGLD